MSKKAKPHSEYRWAVLYRGGPFGTPGDRRRWRFGPDFEYQRKLLLPDIKRAKTWGKEARIVRVRVTEIRRGRKGGAR